MALSAGTRVGAYEITGELGAGGMGEVYRATDTNLRRDVAIKVLPPAFANDADRVARFQREAEALAVLNHPNIARIYRHRCVEAWSVVVPWIGFSLSHLLKQVEPTGKAKYVAFETYYDPKVMLSPLQAGIAFPYVEGLRLDEAMHPLTMVTVGMYGGTLPNQDGAPIRITVPWKYGFKSIKSIVRIRFVEDQPPTSWNRYWPDRRIWLLFEREPEPAASALEPKA